MSADDHPFMRGLAGRLAEFGTPPWRDEAQALGFHSQAVDAAIAAAGDRETVVVAIDGAGQPAGFIHLYERADFLSGEAQGYIAVLAVAAAAQGRGVGQALMAAAEQWGRGRGYRFLTLDTFADNARARTFYARLGFIEETVSLVKPLDAPAVEG